LILNVLQSINFLLNFNDLTSTPQRTLDLKDIRSVVELMKRADLTEFELEEEGLKLRLARKTHEGAVASASGAPAQGYTYPPMPVAAAPGGEGSAVGNGEQAPKTTAVEGEVIKSPMVGTFYRAPSPETGPFVQVGDAVRPETVLCIIEAMKVMNEIQAETSGTITEVLVENGQSVEYGQPLFRIRKVS
jgi:acetyl-CoA carboxylase biotin carboxyl carrier protein